MKPSSWTMVRVLVAREPLEKRGSLLAQTKCVEQSASVDGKVSSLGLFSTIVNSLHLPMFEHGQLDTRMQRPVGFVLTPPRLAACKSKLKI